MRTTQQMHEAATAEIGVNPRGGMHAVSGELVCVVDAVKDAVLALPADDLTRTYFDEFERMHEDAQNTVLVVSTAKVLALTNLIFGVAASVTHAPSRRSRRRFDREADGSETETETESTTQPDVSGE